MKKIGALSFVLHSHLPYARLAGRWPHGEEWLHEAAAETYIPLLNALYRLRDEGVPIRLTLTLTPILLEQLADEVVQRNFREYMQARIEAITADIARFKAGEEKIYIELAQHYLDLHQDYLHAFDETYGGNLVTAFRHLQELGLIEIATCAATHGYLPLLSRDESIQLQLRTAIQSYQRHFGRKPYSIWLPECAYRPAMLQADGQERKGLEAFLSEHDLRLFFAETQMVEQGKLIDLREADNEESSATFLSRVMGVIKRLIKKSKNSTFESYNVDHSNVAVLARNRKVSLQVWSADWGYPGDFAYREFHKKDGASGMRYWRVTGAGTDLGDKKPYQLEAATRTLQEHAEHFYQLVVKEASAHFQTSKCEGIIAANFDTELFGHWWYEGVDWLEAVLRRFANSEEVQLSLASDYIDRCPPQKALQLPRGSWGAGGDYSVWDNEKTQWMWLVIHDAEERMEMLVKEHPSAFGVTRQILDLAARELLLLQSSDWPFLITTGQADRYAVRRFLEHVERFNQLIGQLSKEQPEMNFLAEIWERDKIFPEIDYKWYSA
jgi:1,4-alpha-glucan branching enzyme